MIDNSMSIFGDEETRYVANSGSGNTKFFLIGAIDPNLVDKFVGPFAQAMDEQAELKNPKPLTLYIQGPGGYYDSCTTILSLMNVAKNAGITIRTVVTGEVASASSMIAVAGTIGHRYIAPMAEHMLHYGWTTSEGESPMEIERSNAQAKRFFRQVARHYEQHCSIPNLNKNFEYDQFYVPAQQCLRWKLADQPLEKLIP